MWNADESPLLLYLFEESLNHNLLFFNASSYVIIFILLLLKGGCHNEKSVKFKDYIFFWFGEVYLVRIM